LNELPHLLTQLASKINSFGGESSNYGSLAAALVAAFIFFCIKEFYKVPPRLSGVLYTKSIVEHSAYNPYIKLKVYRTLVIFSDGNIINGTSEKTGEKNKKNNHYLEYIGEKRVRGIVTGRVERRYLRRNLIHIHIEEYGKSRNSSTYIQLNSFKKSVFSGSFFSTAADTKGTIKCKMEKYVGHPSQSVRPHSS